MNIVLKFSGDTGSEQEDCCETFKKLEATLSTQNLIT